MHLYCEDLTKFSVNIYCGSLKLYIITLLHLEHYNYVYILYRYMKTTDHHYLDSVNYENQK